MTFERDIWHVLFGRVVAWINLWLRAEFVAHPSFSGPDGVDHRRFEHPPIPGWKIARPDDVRSFPYLTQLVFSHDPHRSAI